MSARKLVGGIVLLILGFGGILLLFTQSGFFLLYIVTLLTLISIWLSLPHTPFNSGWWVYGVPFGLGILISAALELGPGPSVFAPQPSALFSLFTLAFGLRIGYRVIVQYMLGGYGGLSLTGKFVTLIIGLSVFSWFIFFVILNGDLANLSTFLGPAGNVIAGGAAEVQAVAGSVQRSVWTSKSVVRARCVMELGGVAGAAFVPSTEVSKCVREKLGQTQTPNATSEQVTQPLEVRVQNVEVIPLQDKVNVRVPLRNTFVTDRRGVPIDMPAKDVEVTVQWLYDGNVVLEKKAKNVGSLEIKTIPNGDTRDATVTGVPYGTVNAPVGDPEIKAKLRAYQGSGDKNKILKWFTGKNRGGGKPVSEARIRLIARASDDIDEKGRLPVNNENLADSGSNAVLVAGPDYEYDVRANIRYTYNGVEAAFTDSSRWRSGNHLLEIWKQSAWNSLSPEKRQQWKQRKCGTIEKYKQKLQRQRTAALTTPVYPVMYALCADALFSQAANGKAKVTVTVNIRDKWVNKLNDKGYWIKDVSSTCTNGIEDDKNDIRQGWYLRSKSGQWDVPTTRVPLKPEFQQVTGEKTSVGCSTTMKIRMNFSARQENFVIPEVG